MPALEKVLRMEITPEQFVRSCKVEELKELVLILNSRAIQYKIKSHDNQLKIES